VLFKLLGGLVMEARLIAFLERLLGEQVDPAGQIAVSSTQRAQIVSWLQSNGVSADFNRFKANLMSVADILAGGQAEVVGQAAIAPVAARAIPALRPVAPVAKGGGAVPIGLGIDLQAMASMPEASDYRSDTFYARNFTPRELAHCIQQGNPRESLAGIWAAKEAVIKAGAAVAAKVGELGSIEIVHTPEGAPGFPGCLISISHEAGMAAAVCVRLG
jgi:phosphopantetheine--protein transferase-like protein